MISNESNLFANVNTFGVSWIIKLFIHVMSDLYNDTLLRAVSAVNGLDCLKTAHKRDKHDIHDNEW